MLIGPNSEYFGCKLRTTNLKSLTLIGWAFFCQPGMVQTCWEVGRHIVEFE